MRWSGNKSNKVLIFPFDDQAYFHIFFEMSNSFNRIVLLLLLVPLLYWFLEGVFCLNYSLVQYMVQ
jgi:hypothetical protein